MLKTVIVIDGMGGGIGAQLVARIAKGGRSDIALLALAANAIAAQKMVEAGAQRGASGENAFRVTLPEADFIIGPLGIALPNSMMGEITPLMAECVLSSKAKRIILPLVQRHLAIVGLAQRNLSELVEEAVSLLFRDLDGA